METQKKTYLALSFLKYIEFFYYSLNFSDLTEIPTDSYY